MLDLVPSKLLRPLIRPGTVDRSPLIERLAHGDPRPVISVAAPAGYGKTTLLSQWAERECRAFAWVSVDEGDNDPKVLLTYIAEALDAVEPISGRVFDALASSESSVPGSVIPRLASAFRSMSSPVALVLDDVHVLHSFECRAAVSVLADHVPGGSRLVLAGRAAPPLRVARLRAEGRILEIGPGDLSLTSGEASSLLRSAGVILGADEAAELHRRTEGWPAGLYLAALYLREGGSTEGAAGSFSGRDRFVSGYIESELLARISGQQRVFLTRTAVLERMCGPLCDAVLGLDGGAAVLAELARSNLLLVPLDRQRQWYRYHRLFRDMLLAELDRGEPALIPALRCRAADWCLDNGLAEEALEYSIAAGDVGRVARLVEERWLQVLVQGRDATLQRWIQWLDDRGGVEEHPMVAVAAAASAAAMGRPALHRGDGEAARQQAVSAQRVRPWLSYAVPYMAVQARIELTRVYLALADLAGARTLLREIDEVLKRRPGLGTLAGEAEALRALLVRQRGSIVPGPSALTAAELRLLPMLSTHLPMHEIAAEMHLSPHTVRTQGKSIYRKLGVTTRSQAIARARELGLLEG